MPYTYRGWTLNSYRDFPNYDREAAIHQGILSKLPVYGSSYVSSEHYHARLSTPTAGTPVMTVDDSSNVTLPNLVPGLLAVDTNHNMYSVTGGVTGLSASQVSYAIGSHPSFTSVQNALDYLLYVPAAISSFTNNAGTVYKGSTVTGFTANWAVSGTITAQTLTGKTPALGDRTATYTGLSLTTDTSYTLTISDAVSSPVDTAISTIYFRLRKYYGVSASATPDSAAIKFGTAVASINTNASRALASVSITPGGNYPYYAFPSAWGVVSLLVNGFATVWNVTTVSITSIEGDTENYTCYTSPNQVVGDITLVANAA